VELPPPRLPSVSGHLNIVSEFGRIGCGVVCGPLRVDRFPLLSFVVGWVSVWAIV
jgi:hypothetical protein